MSRFPQNATPCYTRAREELRRVAGARTHNWGSSSGLFSWPRLVVALQLLPFVCVVTSASPRSDSTHRGQRRMAAGQTSPDRSSSTSVPCTQARAGRGSSRS
jgi:hypothetical protein